MSAAAAGENGTTYRCFITDSSGNTVISEEAAIHTDPLGFTRQPEDYSCGPTDRACFSVEAYGTDVTYQWQFQRSDGPTWYTSNAPGAQTNAINFLASENFGMSYRCVITDSEGNVAYSDPAKVLADSITWDFEYNADGMRTSRTNGVVTYEYVYNGSQLTRLYITDELDGSQSVMAFAYDASGKPLSLNYNGTRYIYATNIQGDVIAILNADGTAIVTYTYDAWGNPLSVGGTHAATLGADNPLRYRGYVWDQEIGLYYLQSRYYDPQLGRFINADTYTSTGQGFVGNNMFVYCLNNPIRYIDSSGDLPINGIINSQFMAYGGSACAAAPIKPQVPMDEPIEDNTDAISDILTIAGEMALAAYNNLEFSFGIGQGLSAGITVSGIGIDLSAYANYACWKLSGGEWRFGQETYAGITTSLLYDFGVATSDFRDINGEWEGSESWVGMNSNQTSISVFGAKLYALFLGFSIDIGINPIGLCEDIDAIFRK